MNKTTTPTAPPAETAGLGAVSSAPPSYDEAVGNVTSGTKDQNFVNPAQTTTYTVEDEASKRKDNEKKEAPLLNAAPPPVITAQPQPETTYNFAQPVYHQPVSPTNDCLLCCWLDDGRCLSDLCYCIFCCSRHVTGHDAGCCQCDDTCCACPDGCCECGDCDCGDCDCGDCDCGSCDCGGADCNCGDCVIL